MIVPILSTASGRTAFDLPTLSALPGATASIPVMHNGAVGYGVAG